MDSFGHFVLNEEGKQRSPSVQKTLAKASLFAEFDAGCSLPGFLRPGMSLKLELAEWLEWSVGLGDPPVFLPRTTVSRIFTRGKS